MLPKGDPVCPIFEGAFLISAGLGLQAARKAVFNGIHWQLCQSLGDLQQNASQYVPRQGMKREVAADIRGR